MSQSPTSRTPMGQHTMSLHRMNQTRHDPSPPPPRPTIAPAIVGLGIAMLFAGAVLHWLVAVAGVGLLALGIADWMLEVRHEWECQARLEPRLNATEART